jgi:hypothetical protein
MSQLTEQYEIDEGTPAIYDFHGTKFYTAKYVNWLEKLVEGVRERAPNSASLAIAAREVITCYALRPVSKGQLSDLIYNLELALQQQA